jgi:hypothetical protein
MSFKQKYQVNNAYPAKVGTGFAKRMRANLKFRAFRRTRAASAGTHDVGGEYAVYMMA